MAAKPNKPGDRFVATLTLAPSCNTDSSLFRSLFNNPILSDVKIKLHYKDTVCEYHAHKAVLASGSQFFLNAFTGLFIVRDARSNI
jgi:hypothetical protein